MYVNLRFCLLNVCSFLLIIWILWINEFRIAYKIFCDFKTDMVLKTLLWSHSWRGTLKSEGHPSYIFFKNKNPEEKLRMESKLVGFFSTLIVPKGDSPQSASLHCALSWFLSLIYGKCNEYFVFLTWWIISVTRILFQLALKYFAFLSYG